MIRTFLATLALMALAGCSATVHQAAFTGPYAGVAGSPAASPPPR